MTYDFGRKLKISVFGQSHGEAIGVVMDGLPAGEEVDLAAVAAFMARRAPGTHALSTARKEADFLAGIGCSVTYFDRPRQCEISGGSTVEAVTCDGETVAAEGVFLLRPTMAPAELFPGLAVESGYVTVNRNMETNLEGVFAAGDCTGGPLQVSKAVGEGLVAGQSAAVYVSKLKRKETIKHQ